MRRIVLFCFLFRSPLWAHEEFDLLTQSVVDNPSVSKKCENLQKDRDNKSFVKNSLDALLLRTKKTQKVVPENKVSLLRKLEYNKSIIQEKRERASRRLKRMEEGLIREGCPLVLQSK